MKFNKFSKEFFFAIVFFSFFMVLNHTHAQNNALNFDGSNDYVSCGNAAAFQISTGTIEAWVKTANAGSSNRVIVAKLFAYALILKDNVLITYEWSGSVERSTGVNLADNQWHHVAMSFQSGVANGTNIYIDGNLVLTTTTTIGNQTQGFNIGGAGFFSQFINGSIDEVRVWNVVRTQAEIQSNINLELSSGTGLIAAFHFNQGDASGNNSGVTTLNNALGGNNGSLNNFGLTGATSNWVDGSTSVLPVELSHFKGKNTALGILLTWQTVSEINNQGFDIERSTDGVRFEKIGFVAGVGTTKQKQNYSFTDKSLIGITYYRLKQIDFDGGFEYSNIISIDRKGEAVVSIFPNPGNGIFTIIGVKATEEETFTLMNSIGQTMSINVQNNGQMDMSAYPIGVYYLRVASSGQVLKLVKE